MARNESGVWLSRLTSLIPPPETPVDVGPPERRSVVEDSLGLALPDDLFEVARVYGSGEFRTDEYSLVLSIANPCSRFFVRTVKATRKKLAGFWAGYDVYPDKPGLLPCGTGEGPRDLYFYTEGTPNRWPLLTSISTTRLARIDLSLLEYVFRLFDGSLEGEVGAVDNPWFGEKKGRIWFQSWG